MNSAKQIDNLVAGWVSEGLSKAEIVVKTADAEIGWCYVWGATGQQCTPSNRRTYANRTSCPASEKEITLKKCQVTRSSNPKSDCNGCAWFPGGERTLMDDCQGFVKQICGRVGIKFTGGGCTSMWGANSNWSAKGEIATLPEKVCCVFWQNQKDRKTMEHIGFYIGGGMMIHCSGEVKKEKLSAKCTHWAIPAGLDGDVPVPVEYPTLRRGDSGSYVSLMQTELVNRGYSVGASGIDGKFGKATEAAVKQFQSDHSLKADGICGPKTWEALQNTDPIQLYTVHIPGLPMYKAEALVASYDNATMTKE